MQKRLFSFSGFQFEFTQPVSAKFSPEPFSLVFVQPAFRKLRSIIIHGSEKSVILRDIIGELTKNCDLYNEELKLHAVRAAYLDAKLAAVKADIIPIRTALMRECGQLSPAGIVRRFGSALQIGWYSLFQAPQSHKEHVEHFISFFNKPGHYDVLAKLSGNQLNVQELSEMLADLAEMDQESAETVLLIDHKSFPDEKYVDLLKKLCEGVGIGYKKI